ncbi:MAG: 30S ribosomal protein S6 [Flammeovirgaceae bacterium]
MSMRHYETVFIIDSVLSEQQIKETAEKFENFLKDKGAEVYHKESWGVKKLAYTIAKRNSGYYMLFEFKAEPSLPLVLETEYKRDERIIRYLTVSLDKYGVDFNQRRRAGEFSAKKSTQPLKERETRKIKKDDEE